MLDRKSLNKSGRLLILIIAFVWALFVMRAVQVQILDRQKFADYADAQQRDTMPLAAKRGAIYDCTGRPLAYDIEAKSYTVNPKYMKRPSDSVAKLATITGKPRAYWFRQFEQHPGFLLVARRVTPEMKQAFERSGIETLKSRSETKRIYPYGDLAAEVVGRIDADGKGVSGLEMQYSSILSGADGMSIYLRDAYGREVTSWEHTLVSPRDGADIYLTLNLSLQEIVESELQKMLDSCGAIWATAVFLDVETGGIMACATREMVRPNFLRCRPIVDMNEPGSTAKLIPLSTVFQAGIFEPYDVINVENGRFVVGGHLIRDDHAYSSLRCAEIGVYSSNIGAAKLGLTAGAELIYRSLVQFGFGVKTGVDFPGEASGALYKPSTWSKHSLATTCFGYNMSASALQIACAYGAIASGGELHKPFFATKTVYPDSSERTLNSKTVVRNVLDGRTVQIMREIFRNVVTTGTAKKAMDEFCPIAGKTGTALRTKKGGGYDTRRALASFTGYFPADDPSVVGIVMFDEPKTSIYGGEIAAPVFRNIAKRFVGLPGNRMLVDSGIEPGFRIEETIERPGDGVRIVNAAVKRTIGEVRKSEPAVPGGFPDFSGKTIRDALRAAKALGYDCRIAGTGVVMAQIPLAGSDTTGVQAVELIGEKR